MGRGCKFSSAWCTSCKVVGKVQLLLPRRGVQRHAVAGLDRTGQEAIRRVARALARSSNWSVDVVEVHGHKPASRGGRHGRFIHLLVRGRRLLPGPSAERARQAWARASPARSEGGLRFAVVMELEVFFTQGLNRRSLGVAHHHANHHEVAFRLKFEGGWNVLGGDFLGRCSRSRGSGLGDESTGPAYADHYCQ